MKVEEILTDDREAVNHVDSIAFWNAAVWARDYIAQKLEEQGCRQ